VTTPACQGAIVAPVLRMGIGGLQNEGASGSLRVIGCVATGVGCVAMRRRVCSNAA
jgi:hypothetical protein